jgi:hypothetical protein
LRGDAAAVNKMFPLELKILIAENCSWAASYYGIVRNRGKNNKKFSIISTRNGFKINGQQLRTTDEINITFTQAGKKWQPTQGTCSTNQRKQAGFPKIS